MLERPNRIRQTERSNPPAGSNLYIYTPDGRTGIVCHCYEVALGSSRANSCPSRLPLFQPIYKLIDTR